MRGIRAENAAGGGVRITFTSRAARLHRRIAGLRTFVRCQAVVANGPLLVPVDRVGELFAPPRTPLVRRPLRIRHAAGTRSTSASSPPYAACGPARSLVLPLTPAGAAYLAARRVGNRLVAALEW